ncbi:MAG: ANTAR domain-containing protein [Actinobacteria bacterium]|nr:ANTAR domain-containing protein [Actinomycetota bacterium]
MTEQRVRDGWPGQSSDIDKSRRQLAELSERLANVQEQLALTAIRLEQSAARSANLEVALRTNRRIGVAVGIIMATEKITEDEAFAQLVHLSQTGHRKLRELADDVVYTGTLPGR